MNFFGKPDWMVCTVACVVLSLSMFPQILRDEFAMFDNNMFVTAWILEALLEANSFGSVKLDEGSLLNVRTPRFSLYTLGLSFFSPLM